MSDHIAHIAIAHDVTRLAGRLPELEPSLAATIAALPEETEFGSVTRKLDKFSVPLLTAVRDRWADGDEADRRKLAFVLGGLTHRAADRLTKPITYVWQGQADEGGSEKNVSKVLQDVFVFREVFGSGEGPMAGPFSPGVIGEPDTDAGRAAEAWFRLMLRRALIAMHTFNPDTEHAEAWIDELFRKMQRFPKSLELYAELHRDRDPAKEKKYLTDLRFYDRGDPIIVLARQLQRGEPVAAERVAAAWRETDKAHSRYARALAKGLDYLDAVGRFWRREIDADALAEGLDIGVPELSIRE